MTKHITIAITEAAEARFQAEAERLAKPVEEVVAEFVEKNVDYDAWFEAEVQKGIDAADRGEFVSHDEFVERGRRLQEELRAKSSKR